VVDPHLRLKQIWDVSVDMLENDTQTVSSLVAGCPYSPAAAILDSVSHRLVSSFVYAHTTRVCASKGPSIDDNGVFRKRR